MALSPLGQIRLRASKLFVDQTHSDKKFLTANVLELHSKSRGHFMLKISYFWVLSLFFGDRYILVNDIPLSPFIKV